MNCLKVDRIEDYKKNKKIIFDRKIHKQVGKLRRRLFLQLSETQFTGLRRQRPPLEIAARWRCVPLIKNMTAHYNSQFCASFHYCFHCTPLHHAALSLAQTVGKLSVNSWRKEGRRMSETSQRQRKCLIMT